MPKPTTKTEHHAAITKEHQALAKQLEALSPEVMTRPGVMEDQSVKDILAHLIEWQKMNFFTPGCCPG